MLVEMMLVAKRLGDRHGRWIDRQGLPCHKREFLDNHRMAGGLAHILAPTERTMSSNQNRRAAERIHAFKATNDNDAGIGFVLAFDLLPAQRWGYRDRTVEVVGMCRSEAWDLPDCLRPCGRVTRMRVS